MREVPYASRVASTVASPSKSQGSFFEAPFEHLGVRQFINCTGVRAINGNCRMLPEVEQAMAAAAHSFVNLDELMLQVGKRLGALTGAEWGIVTAGSAAALALAAAGCIAGNDPERMVRLPMHCGPAALVPGDQRFAYEQALRLAGLTIRSVGSVTEVEMALARHDVALICINAMREARSHLPLKALVPVAQGAKVPVLVDAASVYPQNPDPWLARGADLVVYSGGKFLRGPPSTGLLLGRRELVEAAWLNGAPHQSFGRPMKIGKEEVVGALAAVEHWFGSHDHAADERRWRADLAVVAAELEEESGILTEVAEPVDLARVPRLRVQWDTVRFSVHGLELREWLLAGSPSVMLDEIRATSASVVIDPYNFQPGEAQIVARRMREELRRACARRGRAEEPIDGETPLLTGRWRLHLSFLHRRTDHEVVLGQSGTEISGIHRATMSEAALKGVAAGGEIRFTSSHPYEAANIAYTFVGRKIGDELTGVVTLGAATDGHWGPVFCSQFGKANWRAKRIGASP
ncbi:aminotransferase class V-fold PLP-dependent enzyme [Bradyrhizobium sp. Gha]|uniref:aminotransferase class V-fold PLP-dependent enzyme n=1 Tax=Bradyrhizobium sp. Gha TaxID=1855318 RepID=UPI0008EBA9D4|nr:aminotransferase class V-fold PLP-dependent enzyme [Bradyrhizobium sp. Gha]SFK16544.1 L-seryl-tRNA(Ser) seleniumtransferase [Bradyrhizobium sp. Gha]